MRTILLTIAAAIAAYFTLAASVATLHEMLAISGVDIETDAGADLLETVGRIWVILALASLLYVWSRLSRRLGI
ncbi:MAG: hypothetical protein ACK4TP_10135 [Hyphomicrobium sp.]